MFRTIFTKTLREYRVPILGWGIGLGLFLLVELVSFTALSPAGRAAFVQSAQPFSFLGELFAMTTPQGVVTWRPLGFLSPISLSIWTILAGARLVRGEEERNSLDLLLAAPRSRMRVLAEKIAALATAIGLIAFLIVLSILIGEISVGIQVDVVGALLAGLNLVLLTFFFAMVAQFLSQVLTSRAAAAGCAGMLLALSFVLDGTGRVADNAVWVQRLSPFLYYHLSKPLIPHYTSTHGINQGAFLFLLVLCIVPAFASFPLFITRDIGRAALPGQSRTRAYTRSGVGLRALERARRDIFLQAVGLRALRAQAAPAFWWLFSLALYAGWITLLVPTMEANARRLLANTPAYAQLLGGHDIATNAGFLGLIVFFSLSIVVTLFALTQALSWPTDLDNGRLELVLSTPRTRSRILLERFGAVLLTTVAAPLVIWLTILAGARIGNLSVDASNVAAASFGLLPLELIVAALVYALAGRLRSGAILGIVSTFILLSFLVEFLRSLLKLPDWVLSLSMFHQYGSTIDGFKWQPFFGMLGVAVVLLVLGVVQFSRSDVGQGA